MEIFRVTDFDRMYYNIGYEDLIIEEKKRKFISKFSEKYGVDMDIHINEIDFKARLKGNLDIDDWSSFLTGEDGSYKIIMFDIFHGDKKIKLLSSMGVTNNLNDEEFIEYVFISDLPVKLRNKLVSKYSVSLSDSYNDSIILLKGNIHDIGDKYSMIGDMGIGLKSLGKGLKSFVSEKFGRK